MSSSTRSEAENGTEWDLLVARREDVAHLYLMLKGARDGTREGRKIKEGDQVTCGHF